MGRFSQIQKLTDAVTAEDVRQWLKAEESSGISFSDLGHRIIEAQGTELIPLCEGLSWILSAPWEEIGPLLSILDATIRWKAKQKTAFAVKESDGKSQ